MDQTPVLICQLCGKGLCGSHHGQENETNYQKLVDPPPAPYKQILPDQRYDEEEKRKNKKKKGKSDCKQICVSIPVVFGQSNAKDESKKGEETETKEKNKEKEKEKEKEQEEKKEKETEKDKNAASTATKASCLPMGGTNCPPPVKMMLCLPCPPPDGAGQASGSRMGQSGQSCKPKDYAYRCESRELRGGNLYSCCQCVKRNGLQHDCPRTPCQGRPACLTKPWPDCWPSGGCHGIDFTREKGTKRYNPCSAQRFDHKVCGPSGGAKADCGGQMMVVVCPPPK